MPQQPYGYPQPPPPRRGPSGCIVALGVSGALLVGLVVGVLLLRSCLSTPTARLGGTPGPGDLLGIVRNPQTVWDESLAVSADGFQTRGFTLPDARNVQVTTTAVSNADKGYMVHVLPQTECNPTSLQPGHTIHQVPGFMGLKVRDFTHTGPVPPGSWCVVVQNSENLLNTMVVHLTVIIDPKQ